MIPLILISLARGCVVSAPYRSAASSKSVAGPQVDAKGDIDMKRMVSCVGTGFILAPSWTWRVVDCNRLEAHPELPRQVQKQFQPGMVPYCVFLFL